MYISFEKYISYPDRAFSTINYAMYRKYLLSSKMYLSIKISLLVMFWRLVNINMRLAYSVNIGVFRAACALSCKQHRVGLPYDFPKQAALNLTVWKFALHFFQNLL